MGAVKANIGKTVDATTCKYDINANNAINAIDMGAAKANIGKVPLACP
jgi:hypothetical protein